MMVPPTPQSRDRLYACFWLKGMRAPNLKVEPDSWCESCQKIVAGKQTFKKRETARWGRYGQQYFYTCPECYSTVIPGAAPASSVIDYSLEAPVIGERDKPLAKNTRERIRRGLERLQQEPFAIRLTHGTAPKPLTLPLVTATTRHDRAKPSAAMVMPVSGNTHEASPGNRAKDAALSPLATVHGSLDRALVMANTQTGVPRPADTQSAQTLRTEGGLSLVYANRAHGVPKRADHSPTAAASPKALATGGHLGVVVSNYTPGWARRAGEQPIGSVTTQDGHSLVIPYTRSTRITVADREAATTLTTRDRLGLLTADVQRGAGHEQAGDAHITDEDIDACRFRMFSLEEIAGAMSMSTHVHGGEYVVTGNKRERMSQLGAAVTPPVMKLLVSRILEVLDEPVA